MRWWPTVTETRAHFGKISFAVFNSRQTISHHHFPLLIVAASLRITLRCSDDFGYGDTGIWARSEIDSFSGKFASLFVIHAPPENILPRAPSICHRLQHWKHNTPQWQQNESANRDRFAGMDYEWVVYCVIYWDLSPNILRPLFQTTSLTANIDYDADPTWWNAVTVGGDGSGGGSLAIVNDSSTESIARQSILPPPQVCLVAFICCCFVPAVLSPTKSVDTSRNAPNPTDIRWYF